VAGSRPKRRRCDGGAACITVVADRGSDLTSSSPVADGDAVADARGASRSLALAPRLFATMTHGPSGQSRGTMVLPANPPPRGEGRAGAAFCRVSLRRPATADSLAGASVDVLLSIVTEVEAAGLVAPLHGA